MKTRHWTYLPQLTICITFSFLPALTYAQCPTVNTANNGRPYQANVVFSLVGLPADLAAGIRSVLQQASGNNPMRVTFQENTTTSNVPQWTFDTGPSDFPVLASTRRKGDGKYADKGTEAVPGPKS